MTKSKISHKIHSDNFISTDLFPHPQRCLKIILSTKVQQDYHQVYKGFDESLFRALTPPIPKVNLIRFGGTQVGKKTHLVLNFVFFKDEWISIVTEEGETEEQIFFIDEGKKLPFFLRYWHHEHRLLKTPENKTVIQDIILFKTPTWLTDILFYPALFLQFVWRIPIYKRIFN